MSNSEKDTTVDMAKSDFWGSESKWAGRVNCEGFYCFDVENILLDYVYWTQSLDIFQDW